MTDRDECQLLNYLRATDIEKRLLLNFGEEPEIKRKVFSNNRKGFVGEGEVDAEGGKFDANKRES